MLTPVVSLYYMGGLYEVTDGAVKKYYREASFRTPSQVKPLPCATIQDYNTGLDKLDPSADRHPTPALPKS